MEPTKSWSKSHRKENGKLLYNVCRVSCNGLIDSWLWFLRSTLSLGFIMESDCLQLALVAVIRKVVFF